MSDQKTRNRLLICLALTASLSQSGCAHVHRVEGAVDQSEIPEGFQVGIGSDEINEGDKVVVTRSVCKTQIRTRGAPTQCSTEKVGEALVLKVLDHDAAIVRPDKGVQLDKTMRVEKLKK